MGLRHGLLASFSLVALTAAAGAQTPPRPPLSQPPAMAPAVRSAEGAAPQSKGPPDTAAASPVASGSAAAQYLPHTLTEALAATYTYQPALQAERAKLRATDENVPTALAGWRPTVVLGGQIGYGDGVSRAYTATFGSVVNVQTDRLIGTAQATVTQNIYNGGKTQANVNR